MKNLLHIHKVVSKGEVFELDNYTGLNIYEDMARRTEGDIYIGVVGPVRTGKSTFIKRFMDLLVIPNLKNVYVKQRVTDELPQSGAGRTVTTTEPKFVPGEAVNISLDGKINMRIRMVDCVGFLVPGAMGHTEDGKTRMVNTPWSDEKISFEEAAKIGTEKVIREHSTIGIVVITDGTIGDIRRENYVDAEKKVIQELKELEKPFVVLLNSTTPESADTLELAMHLRNEYKVPVIPVNCEKMRKNTLDDILLTALKQFPVAQVDFKVAGFVAGLSNDHWIKKAVINAIKEWGEKINDIESAMDFADKISHQGIIKQSGIISVDMGTGIVNIELVLEEGLFYQVASELMGEDIKNDAHFFRMLKLFSTAKKAYDKIEKAIEQVEEKGYGIVQPKLSEMELEEPEVFKQGNKYGVRLKAKAPSLHIIRTDITTEIAPIVGTEKQSEDLVNYLVTEFKDAPGKIWDTNIFGKSLYEMVTEQMENKLSNVPDNIRYKVQKSLQKISDEGKEYYICIVI